MQLMCSEYWPKGEKQKQALYWLVSGLFYYFRCFLGKTSSYMWIEFIQTFEHAEISINPDHHHL